MTVGNLSDTNNWPEFSQGAISHGFHSVHATPLRLRGEVIGTMNLFSVHVGELAPEDIAVGQALADVATIGILQERTIRSANLLSEQLQFVLDSRILIEQAEGVLAATASLSMGAAFTAIPSYARNHNQTLRSVADEITTCKIDLSQQALTKRSNG